MFWIIGYIGYDNDYHSKSKGSILTRKNNNLPIWGNERTMNLNSLILTNIQSSHYFKGKYENYSKKCLIKISNYECIFCKIHKTEIKYIFQLFYKIIYNI